VTTLTSAGTKVKDFRRAALDPRPGLLFAVAALCCWLPAVPAMAQQDPENEKRFGLWFDQVTTVDLAPKNSLELEFHERLNEGASNLFEYFGQGGISFRLRPWLTLIPIYRYQRYPGNPITSYENRLLFNLTLTATRGPFRPSFRMLTEGRFPQNRSPSARFRFRPGIDYTLPLRMTRAPAVVVTDEFFVVPGTNSFASGGSFTQNRFQVGIRLPLAGFVSIRPYYMLQSVNLPSGWDTNGIVGISLAFKF
jgi:hypothetical protein